MIRAGMLRDKITVRRPVETVDEMGGVSRVWQDVATIRCEVRQMSGDERQRYAQVEPTAEYVVTYRGKAVDLYPGDEITRGDDTLRVVWVDRFRDRSIINKAHCASTERAAP